MFRVNEMIQMANGALISADVVAAACELVDANPALSMDVAIFQVNRDASLVQAVRDLWAQAPVARGSFSQYAKADNAIALSAKSEFVQVQYRMAYDEPWRVWSTVMYLPMAVAIMAREQAACSRNQEFRVALVGQDSWRETEGGIAQVQA